MLTARRPVGRHGKCHRTDRPPSPAWRRQADAERRHVPIAGPHRAQHPFGRTRPPARAARRRGSLDPPRTSSASWRGGSAGEGVSRIEARTSSGAAGLRRASHADQGDGLVAARLLRRRGHVGLHQPRRDVASSSASHACGAGVRRASASRRAGHIVPPALTFGPLGSAERLNWLAKNRLHEDLEPVPDRGQVVRRPARPPGSPAATPPATASCQACQARKAIRLGREPRRRTWKRVKSCRA